jgi:hypothetical protein
MDARQYMSFSLLSMVHQDISCPIKNVPYIEWRDPSVLLDFSLGLEIFWVGYEVSTNACKFSSQIA